MAAWDNVTLPQPPSLKPPTVDFSVLGQLGQAYQQGQEWQRQQAIRNAFQGGIPTNPQTGLPDYYSMGQTLAKLGDIQDAQQYFKLGYGTTPQPQVPSPYDPSPSSPGGLQSQSGSGVTQTTLPPPTIPTSRPLAPDETSNIGGDNTTVGPRYNIPPGMSTADAIRNVSQGTMGPGTAQAAPQIASQQPVPPTASTAPDTTPIQPRAVPTTSVDSSLQPRPFQTAQNASALPPAVAQAADAQVPPQLRGQYSGVQWMNRLHQTADQIRQQVQDYQRADAANKITKDYTGSLKRADMYDEQANKIQDTIQKGLDALQQSGLKRGEARYTGIQGAAQSWLEGGQHDVALSKYILNQPQTYTGYGSGVIQDWNKIKAMFGGDPRGAQYYEALQKLTAANVLAVINQTKSESGEAGQQASRIFAGQIQQAEKTGVNIESTLAGNRFLAGFQERLGNYRAHLSELAQDYVDGNAEKGIPAHGTLDAGFNAVVKDDLKKNPVFTAQEEKNPSLIGAPTSPYTDPGQTRNWARQMGIKPKEPIRTPSGKLVGAP